MTDPGGLASGEYGEDGQLSSLMARRSAGAPAGFEPAHTAPEATSTCHADLHEFAYAQVRGARLGRGETR